MLKPYQAGGTSGPMFTAATVQKSVEGPVITLVAPFLPVRGLAYSVSLHALVIAAYVLIPWNLYTPTKVRVRNTDQLLAEYKYEPLVLPSLRAPGETGSESKELQGKNGARGKDSASDGPLSLPMPIYAGQQQVIVHSLNPVNSIQAIKRPDLVNPPKLKYPLNIKSVLRLPTVAPIPKFTPAPSPAPAPSSVPIPQQEIPVSVQVATVETPKLEVRPLAGGYKAPQVEAPKVGAQPVDLKNVPATSAAIPVLRPHVETSMEPTFAVLNAVESPNAKAAIVDAELEGSFAIVPKGTLAMMGSGGSGTGGPGHTPGATGHGSGPGRSSGTGGNAGGSGLGGNGNGTGSGLGSGTGNSGRGSGGVRAAVGEGIGGKGGHGNGGTGLNGAGIGTGTSGTGTGSTGMPGISIVGATSSSIGGAGTIPVPAAPSIAVPSRGTYGMTVVASGSNGGAVRDLGVFAKTETVFTVYVSMADVGGGSDSPLQYAIVRGPGTSTSSSMLTPPYAVKKKIATVPAESGLTGRQVFVRGFIAEDGKLLSPLVVGGRLDDVAKAAIACLEDWQFLPAQLEGQAVKVKVLIGIHVSVQPGH